MYPRRAGPDRFRVFRIWVFDCEDKLGVASTDRVKCDRRVIAKPSPMGFSNKQGVVMLAVVAHFLYHKDFVDDPSDGMSNIGI